MRRFSVSHCGITKGVTVMEQDGSETLTVSARCETPTEAKWLAELLDSHLCGVADPAPVSFDDVHLATLTRLRDQAIDLRANAKYEIGERTIAGKSQEEMADWIGHARVFNRFAEDLTDAVGQLEDAIRVKGTASSC